MRGIFCHAGGFSGRESALTAAANCFFVCAVRCLIARAVNPRHIELYPYCRRSCLSCPQIPVSVYFLASHLSFERRSHRVCCKAAPYSAYLRRRRSYPSYTRIFISVRPFTVPMGIAKLRDACDLHRLSRKPPHRAFPADICRLYPLQSPIARAQTPLSTRAYVSTGGSPYSAR